MTKTSAALARQINATKRSLRRQKRGRNPDHGRERIRVALKSLTELQADPMRPGLAVQVAMNVKRAAA